ncbi:hypothetical protein FSP39_003580 [Pinctada imbricata]|uniref:PDZ domain-containing protein n=1 Tax=Pinctada imbricata TaxID=66713 RepID=A0AA88XWX0_PINIB|nr:hypothetical protein FSP39_003580 [Pinctada imbricata]
MSGFVKRCPCLRPQIEEDVRELDYRHCSLTDVPADVFNFERTLEDLYIDSNQIRDLPRELFYCHGIRKLSISDNEITNIPPAIASLINLEELDLSKNGIIDMPENIKCCKYLRSVDASVNPLGKLPDGFTQLLNLTQLYLNDTFLDYLPGNFGRLSKLKILEIRENHLKTLPKSFSRLTELERLDIGHNEFTELPDVIGNLVSLLELWCDKNQITVLTPTIGNLKQLMFLDATTNHLQSLPSEIEGCSSLADLHLTGNRLQSLPDSIGNLENLTTLKVDNNQLTSIPTTIGGLMSLSELNVSCNELEDLPASLGLLRNIRTFYADENYLATIPAEIGSCNGITVLSVRSNKLEFIPDEIGRIPHLRVLNLSDNRLKCLPFTIIKLKDLQALWLSENQTRPLVPLQSDHDQDTGRKILTCYLLPQEPQQDSGEDNMGGDTDSFHASIWDEERSRRQQIHFEFADDEDVEGSLRRVPTPYPKEMREKVRHAQNLAKRQMMMGDVRWHDGKENRGYEGENMEMSNSCRLSSADSHSLREARITKPSSPTSLQESHRLLRYDKVGNSCHVSSADSHFLREARITKPSFPTSLQESHRLLRYYKEKLAKDKARMHQHRSSASDIEPYDMSKSRERKSSTSSDTPRKVKEKSSSKKSKHEDDDGGFSQSGRPTTLGSMTDIPSQVSTGVSTNKASPSPSAKRSPGFAYCSTSELTKAISQHVPHGGVSGKDDPNYVYSQSSKHKRLRDYDSDTGYRSETEVMKFQRQQMVISQGREGRTVGYESDKESFTPRKERQRGGGYSSDVEGYTSRTCGAAYRAAPVNSLPYQANQQHQQHNRTPQLNNRRTTVKNDELYEQMRQNSSRPKDMSNYAPPSPSMFHRSKILDQSSPVTPEPAQRMAWGANPHSATPGVNPASRGTGQSTADCVRNVPQQHQPSHQDSEKSSTGRPPPYRGTPPHGTSPAQRRLPPTPNRGSPYGVHNYDRRSNSGSPSMYQRISDLTISEQNESDQSKFNTNYTNNSRGPAPQRELFRQSPYQHRNYNQNDPYRRHDYSRTPVSNSDMYNYDSSRVPVSNSASNPSGSDNAHDSSRSSGFSFENSCRPYNPSDPLQTPVNQTTPDRSRTPASVNGGEDDHRDSPRESGYSSREHSSHRNSPCDATQSHFYHHDHSDIQHHSMRNYEDMSMFETHSDPLSQVSSSTDSGYGHHADKVSESPVQYSGYNSVHRPSDYYTPFTTPARETSTPKSREATPVSDHSHQSTRHNDKGIFVTKVQEDGPAAVSLRPGDKILEVNGQDFSQVNHSEAVSAMKNSRTVSLYIERI